MATATKQANLFELSCGGIDVTYSTSSFAGPPQLSYSGPEGELTFSGSEIETLPSALGTEVTVTLDTVAIKSTHPTTIAGPPEGADQTYEAIALHGVAKAVDF